MYTGGQLEVDGKSYDVPVKAPKPAKVEAPKPEAPKAEAEARGREARAQGRSQVALFRQAEGGLTRHHPSRSYLCGRSGYLKNKK